MVHDLVITRAHFECGPLIAPCTMSDRGELVWEGMVTLQPTATKPSTT